MEPEIITFLRDYGILGFLAYIFIKDFFAYLNKNKIADTLKDANADRKTDTDEVARELNSKQEVCIEGMRKDIEFIRLQVSNHLPTAIKEITDKLDKHIEKQNEFETEVLVKVAKL
jgi:hypothetical protein